MAHGLMIAHLKNTRYIHGGHVYRESIKKMLMANDPGLTMDEIAVHDQHHRLWRLWRQVYDILTSPLSRYPAKVNHFRTKAFRQRLETVMTQTPYALFVISGADMLWCLDVIPQGASILFISHNIEHLLYDQQVAKYAATPLLGALLRADAAKFRAFEIGNIQRLRKIITIAAADHETLRAYCPGARIATIMPSFDYAPHTKNRFREAGPLRLGFLGNLEWWPNRRSLQWFLDEIFPQVTRPLELHLYGQGSAAFGDGRRIQGHGFVPDLAEVWTSLDLMIQPITCGAGVNIKVAEALYNRMPIIATPSALRGIPLQEDLAITVLDGAGQWINYLNGPHPEKQALLQVRQDNADLFSMQNNVLALKALLSQDGLLPDGGLG